MAKISELKEMIVELKLDLIRARVPRGHCPYSYYDTSSRKNIDCNEVNCDECERMFMENIEKEIRKEVRRL